MEKSPKHTNEIIKPKFPKKKIVIHSILIIVIITLTCLVIFYEPKPLDNIDKYVVTVTPLEDGRLNIEYKFKWSVLRGDDGLEFVEIGLANENFEIGERSENIKSIMENKSGYGVKIFFDQLYFPKDTFEFSFSIIQGDMLCLNNEKYLYEFVPCWFESIKVDEYVFKWKCHEDGLSDSIAKTIDGYYVWEGSFDYAGYQRMLVHYETEAFDDPKTVLYVPFDGNNVKNEIEDDKITFGIIIVIAGLSAIAYIIIDIKFFYINMASAYSKGSGFKSSSQKRHHSHIGSTGGGSGIGGGRSCACACACAGGGRAGCSQKNTYSNNISKKDINNQD